MSDQAIYKPLSWPDGRPPYAWFWPTFLIGGLTGFFVAGFFHHWAWALSIPYVGVLWIATMLMPQPTAAPIAQRLLHRGTFPFDLWGSPSRAEFAQFVSGVIAEEIGWPNANFVPEDPLEILLYCPCPPGDGMEGLVIFRAIEERVGAPHVLRHVLERAKTLGEFVDAVLKP